MSPSYEEGPASAVADREPLNLEQLPGRLYTIDTAPLRARQVAFLSRRMGLQKDVASILAPLAFGARE